MTRTPRAPSEPRRSYGPCPQVTSDGSGLGGAWHLSEVEIFDTVRNRTTVFPCGQWLDPSDMASLQQTLLPRGVDGALGNLVQYEVRSRVGGCVGRPGDLFPRLPYVIVHPVGRSGDSREGRKRCMVHIYVSRVNQVVGSSMQEHTRAPGTTGSYLPGGSALACVRHCLPAACGSVGA